MVTYVGDVISVRHFAKADQSSRDVHDVGARFATQNSTILAHDTIRPKKSMIYHPTIAYYAQNEKPARWAVMLKAEYLDSVACMDWRTIIENAFSM